MAALAPFVLLSLAAVVVMMGIAFHRSHGFAFSLTLAGLAATLWSLWPVARVIPRQVTPLLRMDGFALYFIGLIVAATLAVAILAYGYLKTQPVRPEEFYVLLLVAALGASVLAASSHFVSFFLGLEILSVALYGLNAYPHRRALPLEAGIKYLVLAAASAAFLLFGMALVYAATGTLDFAAMAGALPSAPQALVLPGAALILVGISFKLALAPFHLWTPDVYQGAPAPVTAFIATASKAGIFAVLIRFFYDLGGLHSPGAVLAVTVLAIASMAVGNLLALRQSNLKRLLAYSSIAHMGYVLVAFEAALASPAVAAAAVEPESIEDYRGLFWRRPWLALMLAAMLLSLAGIPLTAGFLAKFYVVAAGAAATLWLLILVLVVTSVVGLYYYLRVVVALFSTSDDSAPVAAAMPPAAAWLLGVLFVGLIWVGVYPEPFLRLVLALPLR